MICADNLEDLRRLTAEGIQPEPLRCLEASQWECEAT
jgi:hypothetical protein